jgi:hypothetical protein
VKLAKLTIVMLLSTVITQATGNFIPATIVGLLLSVVMHSIGFLDRNILVSAGMYNMIIFLLSTMIISNYSSLNLEALLSMVGPLMFFLLLGVVTLFAGGAAVARLLKMNWRLGAALGPTAMFGAPHTIFVTEEVARSMGLPDEERQKLQDILMPKMVIAGFISVSIAAVIIASVVVPLIFS